MEGIKHQAAGLGGRRGIHLAFPAIGARILGEHAGSAVFPGLQPYRGPSYCDAIRLAGGGGALLVAPGSIEVCRWSPPVLGLKPADSDFEREREPKLPFPVAGVVLARLDTWPGQIGDPEVVILRAEREAFQRLLAVFDPGLIYLENTDMGRSAVPALLGDNIHPLKELLVRHTNRGLGRLNRFPWWTRFTLWAFKREWTSRALNFVLDRSMANMSMCRNSTVIPYISGRVNVSHFCTGGIAWGKNPANCMTGGMPYSIYVSRRDELIFAR